MEFQSIRFSFKSMIFCNSSVLKVLENYLFINKSGAVVPVCIKSINNRAEILLFERKI